MNPDSLIGLIAPCQPVLTISNIICWFVNLIFSYNLQVHCISKFSVQPRHKKILNQLYRILLQFRTLNNKGGPPHCYDLSKEFIGYNEVL